MAIVKKVNNWMTNLKYKCHICGDYFEMGYEIITNPKSKDQLTIRICCNCICKMHRRELDD